MNEVKKVVIPGGSGFLGCSLAKFLRHHDFEIIFLSRSGGFSKNGVRYISWDGKTKGDWWQEIESAYAIVNFTGRSVNCLYNEANKREIITSRIYSVRAVADAVSNSPNPPKVVIQSGSLAIFGDTRKLCDEDSSHGEGFSVEVCEQWEEEFFKIKFPNTRQVLLRIGFALGKNGGALKPLQKLTKYYLGGTTGKGDQYISWLHVDDLNEMFLRSIEDDSVSGIYNATGPYPVTNKEFMNALRKAMGKPWSPPVPSSIVKLGAYLFMRSDPGLALTGRNCIPKKFMDSGFKFKYTDLSIALKELV